MYVASICVSCFCLLGFLALSASASLFLAVSVFVCLFLAVSVSVCLSQFVSLSRSVVQR